MIDESELLERAALEDVHMAAPAGVVERLSLRPFNCAGAFVSLAGRLPASAIVINRTIGLGLDVPATETAALDLGCRKLLTCTGKAVAGDPQHSYRNLLKAGFIETYVRRNFAPPAR